MYKLLAIAALIMALAFTGSPAIAQEEPNLGSITVTVDTNPESDAPLFDFDGDLGDIDLADDGVAVFEDLEAGTYTIVADDRDGWTLTAITCDPGKHDVDIGDRDVDVVIVTDQDVASDIACVFIFEPVPPTATPTATATSTPAPTQTPVIVTQPPTIIRVEVTAIPTAAPRSVIRPPSTGDAGIQ